MGVVFRVVRISRDIGRSGEGIFVVVDFRVGGQFKVKGSGERMYKVKFQLEEQYVEDVGRSEVGRVE